MRHFFQSFNYYYLHFIFQIGSFILLKFENFLFHIYTIRSSNFKPSNVNVSFEIVSAIGGPIMALGEASNYQLSKVKISMMKEAVRKMPKADQIGRAHV